MLKNKLVTKEHFIQKILYSGAVTGGEKGVDFTGSGGRYFAFPTLPQEMLSREVWKRSKITKNLPEEVASCASLAPC